MTTQIPTWPAFRVNTTVTPNRAQATIQFNGATWSCAAPTIEILSAGVIAHVAKKAIALDRPIALDVDEQLLAVRPNGIVQAVAPDKTIPDDDNLLPVHGECRRCGNSVTVTATECSHCEVTDPLSVQPPQAPAPTAPPKPQAALTPAPTIDDMTIMVPSKPPTTVLVLETEGEPSLSFTSTVLIGRRPEVAEGQTPLRVASPTREISRNHVTVALEADHVIVTDLGSVNGTYVNDQAIDAPTRVAPHDTIKIGDREFKARAVAREAVSQPIQG